MPKLYAIPVTIYNSAFDAASAYRFTGLDLVHLTDVLRRGWVTNDKACIELGRRDTVREVTEADIRRVQSWRPPEAWYGMMTENTIRRGGR